MLLKIALLQMTAGYDRAVNLAKGEQFCRQAAQQGADIALFPEMWSTGYSFFNSDEPGSRAKWLAQAISPDDAYIQHFQTLAQELKMAIAITYLEKWPHAPRNSVALIDRHGQICLNYAKVHTCDFSCDEALLTPGDGFRVCELDTRQGAVKIGAMICYDREFPESARVLMLQGAEIILTPNACTLEIHRLSQFRARAYENMVGLAMTNYAAPYNNGHSCAYTCMAFDGKENSLETKLIEAGEEEGVFIAEFDIDALRAYRHHETWGNAYRKPRHYAIIAAEDVAEPFVRPDSRRS